MNSPAIDHGQIPMTPALAAALARASEVATASGAGEITLEHLLYALCDDPDAIAVLSASRVDVEHLRNETATYVTGGRAVDMPVYGGLAPSEDVSRILEAATAAARGGRRRDINGAIVIAAIVGDGRSFAAHLLHGHGLTFDEAIRALQRAFASSPIHDTQTILPAADDVLARARERVQSRAAPSLRDMMGDGGRAAPLYVPVATQAPAATHAPSHRLETENRAGWDAPVAASAIEKVEIVTVEVADAAASAPSPPVSVELEADPDATSSDAIAAPTPVLEAEKSSSDAEPSPEANVVAPAVQSESIPQEQPRAARATVDSSVLPSQYIPAYTPPLHPNVEVLHGPPASKYPPFDPFPGLSGTPFPPRRPNNAPSRGQIALGVPRPTPVKPPPIPNSPYVNAASGAPTSPHAPWPELDPIASNTDREAMLRPAGEPTFGATPQANKSRSPNLGRSAGSFLQTGAPKGLAEPAPASSSQSAAAVSAPASPREGPASAVEVGQLAENIPRSMRVGVTERVEIRVGKASVRTIVEGLDGGGAAWRHDVVITKAMSIRLRAPDGGFFIETASPETQWIENHLGLGADDFASWRFLITPQYRGYAELQIIVSARTIGADGVAAETALPDQVVEVKVRSNYKRAFATWVGWIAAAIVGGALARFGEAGLDAAHPLVTKFFN